MSGTTELERNTEATAAAAVVSPSVRLPFSRAEYDARIAKTRRAMQAAHLDLLIVSDPTNMAWLTGYDGWSFYVHQCVLLAMDGEPV
jgi:ectoine hydrolase